MHGVAGVKPGRENVQGHRACSTEPNFIAQKLAKPESEIQIVPLPWVRNRFYRRPTSRDTQRRLTNSPLFNRVVHPEPPSSEERLLLCSLAHSVDLVGNDPKVQTALWVFNDERNYINLYKCYEIILSDVGGRVNGWVERSALRRFAHTANSPAAIGYSLARHGRESGAPPEEPMELTEADAVIRSLIVAWITDKVSAQSTAHEERAEGTDAV